MNKKREERKAKLEEATGFHWEHSFFFSPAVAMKYNPQRYQALRLITSKVDKAAGTNNAFDLFNINYKKLYVVSNLRVAEQLAEAVESDPKAKKAVDRLTRFVTGRAPVRPPAASPQTLPGIS